MNRIAAVFFDLGDTLGTATVGGDPRRLVGFDVFPFVPGLLADLQARGLRLGVISNTGDEKKAAVEAVLNQTPGFLALFDPSLLVYSGDEQGVTKASPEIFVRAAARAGKLPAECLFVGESAAERAVAVGAGWVVCPHPLLVAEVLAGQPLRYVRLTVPAAAAATPWRNELMRRAFVPQHLSGARGTKVYGLTSQRVALELVNMRFEVELLGEPDLPRTTDLFLLRDDLARTTGFLAPGGESARVFATPEAGRLVVSATPEGVVVAVPPTVAEGVDAFHFDNARHGHTLKLTPDPLLWTGAAEPAAGLAAGFAAAVPVVPAAVLAELGNVDSTAIGRTVRRYCGLEPLDGPGGTAVKSRHILEAGNARAVAQLTADLGAIGGGRLTVRLHQFNHAGRTLHNVEAELAGDSPELVLVTAHLDSTAASDDGFDPPTSPAPGADDDASGVAAVLAAAERFIALSAAGPPGRTVRFVLFNAEEQGLVGSRAYARRSKARGEAIAAVWQMDMVGYNAVPPLSWEVHAGFEPSPAVEARSRVLANLLAAVAPQVSPELEPVQVMHSGAPGGDPADGRSDHASFQAHGYPACVVSEDFFVDEPGGPEPDANPNYHRHGDTVIDEAYAAAITRAVAAAAWLTANPTPGPAGPGDLTAFPKEHPMTTNETGIAQEPPPATKIVSGAAGANGPVQRAGAQLVENRKLGLDAAPPVIGSRVRVFKQDPSVQEVNIRTVYLPGELKAGPRDDVMRIAGLTPVFPDVNGDFAFHPATAPVEFDAAHTFAVVRQTLNMFERQLGEPIPWQWNRNGGDVPLKVFPHGGEGANAFYSREDRELRFFHFTPTGQTVKVFTCRSLDIVGHEAGHAILDALRPDWWVWPAPPQLGGLHESFGDLTTIFLILSQLDLAEFVVAETKADLHQKSVLSALAEEFGASLHRLNGLRNANNDLKISQVTNEVHDISQVFTGAVFDVLADLYATRRRPQKKDDAEVLHETAMYLGGLLLQAIRAADTSSADDQFNAYRTVANKLCDVAKAGGDGTLCDLITHHFTRREVTGVGAFDAPRVAARAGGSCGTIRILGRGSQH